MEPSSSALLVDRRSAKPTCVSILDTGFRPELIYRSAHSHEWLTVGRNWVEPDTPPIDIEGHGTGVLSILAADRSGLKGENTTCNVLVNRVLGTGGRNIQRNWAEAISYSLSHFDSMGLSGVILLTSGTWGASGELIRAIDMARERDCILVTIAHNDNIPLARYPGRLSESMGNVICVGATDSLGGRLVCNVTSRGSNYGNGVTLYFNGQNIRTLDLDGSICEVSGTSASGARVAGVVASIRQINPALRPSEIRDILLRASIKADGDTVNNLDPSAAYHLARAKAADDGSSL